MTTALTDIVPPMLQLLEDNMNGDYYAGEVSFNVIISFRKAFWWYRISK